MADNYPAAGKVKRSRRRKNRPPPIFTRDAGNLNPFSTNSKDSMFRRNNFLPSPSVPLNSNEIFDRFNQLLDWHLPNNSGNSMGGRQPEGYAANDERYAPPPRGQELSAHHSSGFSMDREKRLRDTVEPFNQSEFASKRWKDTDDRIFPSSETSSRIIPDNVGYDRRDTFDNSRANVDRFLDSFDPPSDVSTQRREVVIRNDFYSEGTNDRWLGERNLNDRDGRFGNPQDTDRDIMEYWPNRIAGNPLPSSQLGDDQLANYRDERVNFDRDCDNNFKERENYYRRDDLPNNDFYRRENEPDDRFVEGNFDLRDYIRERELQSKESDMRCGGMMPSTSRNSIRGVDYREEFSLRGSSRRSRSPINTGGRGRSPSPAERRPGQEKNLTVLISKSDQSRITFQEADSLRKTLVDIVMNCTDSDQMPEFVNSGLMRNGVEFFVNCRTLETKIWLLKQKLPPLNGSDLIMEREQGYETVKISAFLPRFTRTSDEIKKLLLQQNGKKGFNFDLWKLRSYQQTPKGVYIAFDIAIDEVRTLRKFDCQLSLELKSHTFKISSNRFANPFRPSK